MDDATLGSFIITFNGMTVEQSSLDSIRWDLESKGIFTIYSRYMKLVSSALPLLLLSEVCLFVNLWLHLNFLFLLGKHPMRAF